MKKLCVSRMRRRLKHPHPGLKDVREAEDAETEESCHGCDREVKWEKNPFRTEAEAKTHWTAESPERMQCTANYVFSGAFEGTTVHLLRFIQGLWRGHSRIFTNVVVKGLIRPEEDIPGDKERSRKNRQSRPKQRSRHRMAYKERRTIRNGTSLTIWLRRHRRVTIEKTRVVMTCTLRR